MISAWTKHLPKEEQEQFKNEVLGSKTVLKRLQVLLKELEDDLNSKETNVKTYDLPNWDYRQAHLNGFRDCLNKLNLILTLDPKE